MIGAVAIGPALIGAVPSGSPIPFALAGPASGDPAGIDPWIWATCLLGAFLLGSVPFAHLLGRAHGIDLRQLGSGNVGATNLGRNVGVRWGLLAFFLDAAKGATPVAVALGLGLGDGPAVGCGAAAVVGHCYSPFLRFRGGKGVATMAGVLAALHPPIFGGLLAIWSICLAILRNIGISSSITALVALAVGVWLLADAPDPPRPWFAGLLLVLPIVVIVRHRSNIRRFLTRTEGAQ